MILVICVILLCLKYTKTNLNLAKYPIFYEYPFGAKGYKVMSLATKKTHTFIDVIFHGSIFPFSLFFENNFIFFVLKSISISHTSDYTDGAYYNIFVDYNQGTNVTILNISLETHLYQFLHPQRMHLRLMLITHIHYHLLLHNLLLLLYRQRHIDLIKCLHI